MPMHGDENLRCVECKYSDIKTFGNNAMGDALFDYHCAHKDPEAPIVRMTPKFVKLYCPLDKPVFISGFERFKTIRRSFKRVFGR